ncbi:MAG: NAD-dependent epimerase/dehydratase family protein [Propionibacteriales bacterium]|nr:NAD-dependent epimerase/dehydratase family protein [Propionibacteriales bacterium]
METIRKRLAVVTGAAGFLGRHLVDALLTNDWQVVAFCRPSDRYDLLPSEVSVGLGDLTDRDWTLAALPGGVDTVFHVAGNTSTWSRNRDAQFADNVDGTANLVDAALASGARRLVFTSSISAYGYQPGVRLGADTPSNAPERGDNYGRSKLAAERVIKDACAERGLNAIILNPVNILGAGDATNWSKQLIMPISRGTLRVVPPGTATWVWVHDIVAAHLAAADAGEPGTNMIIGGVEASFAEVVAEIAATLGIERSARPTPRIVLAMLMVASSVKAAISRSEPELSLAKYRRAVGDLLVDDAPARSTLGLRHTPLTEQITDTVAWLQEVGLLDADQVNSEQAGARA